MLSGYKTYIVAFIVALIAISEGVFGIDIPGADMKTDWFNYVLMAFGLGGLRAAVPAK